MNKTYLLAIAAALMAAPLAFAHNDGGPYGTPKTYCEPADDQYNHDYGSPAIGLFIAFGLEGSVPPCPYNPFWDGHYEFAIGGAWLLACEGAGFDLTTGEPQPPACPTYSKPGHGTLVCWGTYADHSEFPAVWVFDHVLTTLGFPVFFTVAADHRDTAPPSPENPNCGDFESDYSIDCVNHCKVPFLPGKDGSYQVFVTGTFGHVWST